MTRRAINGMERIGRAAFKQVVEGDLVTVMSWDDEWGHAAQLVGEARSVTRADRS